MSDLRATILADEQVIASKRRFALFSHPPPLAVGDDGPYQKNKPPRGQNGKPITKPPQMLGGTCRTGITKSSYFNVPQSILQNDPYKSQYDREIKFERKMHTRSTFHENQFKPASCYKTLDKASYRYKQENPQNDKKIIRDQTGKVKTAPRNCTTNPISKVQTDFFKPLKHMTDQYDRKKQIAKRQRQVFNSKLPPDCIYNGMSHGNRPFIKDSTTYGEDHIVQKLVKSRKTRAKTTMNFFPHQSTFKPARRGHGDAIGRYPQFIDRKTSQQIPPKKKIKQESKQKWRPNNFGLTRPTPSISFHPINLKVSKFK